MPSLFEHFQQQLQPFLERPLYLAYSGGIDSQVLLHLAARLKVQQPEISIIACHVNHGLSDNAEQWQTFAKAQCQQYGITFVTESVSLVRKNRQSVEAIARQARYQVLDEVSKENALILTGHHLDDQLETFLLALKRGSGVQGLSAMQSCIAFGKQYSDKLLLRPLLAISREKIAAYANEHQLAWIDDESNENEAFDRNFIRHQVTPQLSARWPSLAENVARSARHCQEAQAVITEVARQDLTACLLQDDQLDVKSLLTFSYVRQKHLVRLFLANCQLNMPSESQIDQLLRGLTLDHQSNLQVKTGNKWLRQFKGRLYLTDSFTSVDTWQKQVDLATVKQRPIKLVLPDNIGTLLFTYVDEPEGGAQIFSLPEKKTAITVSFGGNNETVLPDFRQHHRALKKLWQELNVAPWLRKRTPLLYINNELAVACRYFVCQPYMVDKQQLNIKVDWLSQTESG